MCRENGVGKIAAEKETKMREKSLYHRAKELEENKNLINEMVSWDKEFSEDGLKNI